MREKKLQVPSISSYAFSKCNEDKSKVSLFLKRPAVTVMHGKIQLLPMKNAKVPNQGQLETYVEPFARQIG